MAAPQEPNDDGGGWWSWGSGLIAAAKQKSEEVITMYKKDLTEFGTTVTEDTKKVMDGEKQILDDETRSSIAGTVSTGWSVLETYAKKLTDTFADDETKDDEFENSLKQRIKQLQSDPASFSKVENEESDPEFIKFKTGFNLEEQQGKIQYILGDNPQIMELYQQLVPEMMAPKDFWERYFWRVKLIDDEEAAKQDLKKRALELKKSHQESSDLSWGDDLDDEPPSSSPAAEVKQEPQPEFAPPAPAPSEPSTVDLPAPPSPQPSQTVVSQSKTADPQRSSSDSGDWVEFGAASKDSPVSAAKTAPQEDDWLSWK